MSVRIAGLALILLNLAVYVQVTGFEFIHFDDDLYVTDNPLVLSGLTTDGLRYAFSTEPAPMSNPLTLVSHMLDVELFGSSPRGHHLSSLFLHIANSLLMFAVFLRMTTRAESAFLIAALFAVHPLHVETVAWISDRKDLLTTLFWLGTAWAYIEYARANRTRWMIAATLLYALSLLAKPMAVTLPFVLLLLDWWPLGRLHDRHSVVSRVAEKAPLFVLSAIACAGTWYLQNAGGATADLHQFSVGERIANAFTAYGMYVRQTVWPFGLGIYYPAPPGGAGLASALLGASVVATLTTLALLARKSMPWITVGVFWFLGMLVPVIGIVQVGNQLHADRYTYLPIVGLFIAAVFTVEKLMMHGAVPAWRRRITYAAAALLLAALAVRAFDQTSLWRNSEKLFTHTLSVAGESLLIRNNLGNYYLENGWIEKAAHQYTLAERLRPGHILPTYNLAHIAHMHGNYPEAIRRLEPLVSSHPKDADVRKLLAESLLRTGDAEAALIHASAARTLESGGPEAAILLGLSYERLGRHEEARDMLQQTADEYSEHARANVTLANFLAGSGAVNEALPYYHRALKIAPRDATIHYNLGAAFEGAGALDQAILAYTRALELNPTLTEAQQRLDLLAGRVEQQEAGEITDQPPVSN